MKNALKTWACVLALAASGAGWCADEAKVGPPPEKFFEGMRERDREVGRAFYKKHLDVGGLNIVASGEVADEALLRTKEIVGSMLAGRPDVLKKMQEVGTRLIIIGKDQVYTDMPEYRGHPNPAFQNERVRGTGGLDVTSFGEENLLALPVDRYDDESIAVHEFCHTIDSALGQVDPTWRQRLRATWRNAVDKGRWHLAYTSGNQAEYWAEIAQSYFDCNRVNNWNHANVATREQLKAYDPEGYELCRVTFNLKPEQDWRFVPTQVRPLVTAPPAKFKVDPHYTKFTYAREFVVVASAKVSDAALLKANETVRKMFAYRHDVLRALINEKIKLVVLGPGETVAGLPEVKAAEEVADGLRSGYFEKARVIVVAEENVVGGKNDPLDGTSGVVEGFAKAMYAVCATRPVDPEWDKRPQSIVQQYELRVKRIDQGFDEKVKGLFDAAAEKKLWRGTPAAQDRASYFVAGVLAYFDAAGRAYPPFDAVRPVATREALQAYDPALFDLVAETFAYKEHVDWRYVPGILTAKEYPYPR